MSNILQRIITGTLFVGLIIGALWMGGFTSIFIMSLFLILGIVEFFNLFKTNEKIQLNTIQNSIALIVIYGIFIISSLDQKNREMIVLIFPVLFLLILSEIWRKKENPILNIGTIVLALVYLVVPFSLIILLTKESDHNNPFVISMFLLIWTNDTFAYLSGRFFGKTKLFERISPKKTWEGTIGGIVFTLIVGFFISFWGDNNDLLFWLISALIIAPTAIFGDLLESLFKRSLNIKDSGNILPGHGGILDRFDATLFTVPFFYSWFIIYHYF